MKIRLSLLFSLSIVFVFFSQAEDTLSAENARQKICYVEREIKSLAKKGESSALQLCKQGDVLVFDSEGIHIIKLGIAMSRVCELPSIKWVSRNNQTTGICVFTGELLEVVNY